MDTEAIATLLRDVAEQVITPRFQTLAHADVSEKNPGDLVTVADHEAEELITAALLRAYPDAVVLGEEAFEADPGLLGRFAGADHAFTVDPVDGTKNFVHGSPDHAVMVAELRDREIVRSWIHHPQHRVTYVAEQGGGAWRNGERMRVTAAPEDPSRWRAATSRRSWVGHELEDVGTLGLTWVCCGVDYARLAEGETDALLYGHANPWDHAPGALLLTEAGGHLGTLDGEAYDPQSGGRPGLIATVDRATYDGLVPRARVLPRPSRR